MASFFDGLPQIEASAANAFAENRIDRRSEERSENSIETAYDDPEARLYLFAGDRAVLRNSGNSDPVFTRKDAEALGVVNPTLILLGWTPGGPRLAGTLADDASLEANGFRAIDLRSLAVEGAVAPQHLGP